MGKPRSARPVKLFAGLLSGDVDLLRRARQLLLRQFGPTDLESGIWAFDQTDYYREEMGANLQRWFLSFDTLVAPDRLAELKHETNAIENEIAESCLDPEIPRPVNIDPGYLELSKLILASTKDSAHRVYLGHGIYAEITLQFAHGAWQVQPWTYPDFRKPEYHEFFCRVRDGFRKQIAAAHPPPGVDVP